MQWSGVHGHGPLESNTEWLVWGWHYSGTCELFQRLDRKGLNQDQVPKVYVVIIVCLSASLHSLNLKL